MLVARAPAKVNLTLHVLGRRADGYHALESLVAFAGAGDTLTLESAAELSLAVDGPTAGVAGAQGGNLVLKAARELRDRVPGLAAGAFHLVKRLPVAAGLGGGSSDAAAALRLLARLNDLAPDDPAIMAAARATGADVRVCLDPRARMMSGAGERTGPPLGLPPLFAVLVNPGIPVATADVFRALGLSPGDALAGAPHAVIAAPVERADLVAALVHSRNDLEPAAIGIVPAIVDALAALRAIPGCRLARMSGSGASVFGLFDDCRSSAAAARAIHLARADWWVKATLLR